MSHHSGEEEPCQETLREMSVLWAPWGSLTYEILSYLKTRVWGSKGICGSNLPLGFPAEQPQTSIVEL